MTLDFHPEAEAEFAGATAYYEKAEPDLGEEFSLEVHAALRNILSYPTVWPVLEGGVRRCLVNRFPYGILYSVEPDRIFILAVMHLHRQPGCWKSRSP
jgi:plasmid stabilization system protein ParE